MYKSCCLQLFSDNGGLLPVPQILLSWLCSWGDSSDLSGVLKATRGCKNQLPAEQITNIQTIELSEDLHLYDNAW